MDELAEEQPRSRVNKVLNLIGVGFSKARRREMLFGRVPRGLYPTDRDAEHIHDFRFSAEQKLRLYGLGHKQGMALEALHSDTKPDLIRELVGSGLDRRTAEQTVNSLLERGILVEVDTPDFGKVLVVRG